MVGKRELLNVLVAYPYMTSTMVETLQRQQHDMRFVLDSGAFTAWRAGKQIQLDDYCRFLESLPFKPWRYFSLDVIGDAKATMANYETLLKRGFTPIPVFTRGEDVSVLEDFYKTSDVVAIGGLVQTKRNKGFVNGVMKRIGNRKVHWLGFTFHEFLIHYQPYMCDSSSWMSSARYGCGIIYTRDGQLVKLNKQDLKQRPSRKVEKALARLGIQPVDLCLNANWSGQRSVSRMLAAASYCLYSRWLQRTHDVFYFMSVPTAQYCSLLHEQYRRVTDENYCCA